MKLSNIFRLGSVVFSLQLAATTTWADDWPQWRGATRDGISKETGLLKEWPNAGPRLLWQANGLGSGYSTPSVVGDRVYLLGSEGMENEFVQALSVTDGKRLWSTKIGKVGPNDPNMNYPGGRSTPTISGDNLFVLGSDGDLACLSLDGKIQWQKNLRTEFGGKPGRWAYSESVLVDGDAVICTPGGAQATMVALNRKDGAVIWKCAAGDEEAAYASPMLAEIGGTRQYVQFLQKGLVGVDSKSGRLLWRWDKPAQGSPANIPSPIVQGDLIFTGTGRGGGGVVKITSENGRFTVEELYFDKKVPAGIGGGVLVGEYLYGSAGQPMLCLVFKTGELKWEERSLPGASVCFADGHIYLHGENGDIGLIEATPEGYRLKSSFTPPNQPDRGRARAWTHPVISNGRLYVRDIDTMWCYDIRAQLTALR